jgi:uncharacterized membrane protein YgcG
MKNMHRDGRFNGRLAAALAVSAALFVPLAVFGAPALARSASAASQYQYSGSSQYQYRVTLCHRTRSHKHPWVTITVSSNAVKAHIRHGDTMPPCPTVSSGGHHDSGSGSQSSSDGHGNGSHGNNGNGNGTGHHP